jgi:hypothetical protein
MQTPRTLTRGQAISGGFRWDAPSLDMPATVTRGSAMMDFLVGDASTDHVSSPAIKWIMRTLIFMDIPRGSSTRGIPRVSERCQPTLAV